METKLQAYVEVQKYWAEALSKYQGNIAPMYQGGGGQYPGQNNAAMMFMEAMGMKAMKDLQVDLAPGRN